MKNNNTENNYMKLIKGNKAPEFITEDIQNKSVDVFESSKWTFLSFHRFAACPFCNMRTHELIQACDSLQAMDINIISVWPSSTENMLKFVGNETSPFPLVSDVEKVIYKKYGVTKSSKPAMLKLLVRPNLVMKAMKYKYNDQVIDADMALFPAEFLINPEGIVKVAYYGKHFGDHLPVEKILALRKDT